MVVVVVVVMIHFVVVFCHKKVCALCFYRNREQNAYYYLNNVREGMCIATVFRIL